MGTIIACILFQQNARKIWRKINHDQSRGNPGFKKSENWFQYGFYPLSTMVKLLSEFYFALRKKDDFIDYFQDIFQFSDSVMV